jgi:hypothetical protein
MKRPPESYLLVLLLGFLSLNALGGGAALMLAPDGSLLQIRKEWIAHSPFSDFFVPGLILFTVNGLLPMLTLYGLIFRPLWKIPDRANLFPHQHWSWTYALYCGIIAVIWIALQQMMTEYFILQPIISLVGIGIMITALLPRVMHWYFTDAL